MNLLEHYIIEIHKSELFRYVINEEEDNYIDLYRLDMTVNCHGRIERIQTTMEKARFDKARELGYYMA